MYSAVGSGVGHDGTHADLKIEYLPNTVVLFWFFFVHILKNIWIYFQKCEDVAYFQKVWHYWISCSQQGVLLGWLRW